MKPACALQSGADLSASRHRASCVHRKAERPVRSRAHRTTTDARRGSHFLFCLFALMLPAAGSHAQGSNCGSLESHYGPYDYRVHRAQLPVVENRHFTPPIEALIQGTGTASVQQDLEYTLKTFPNHTRALAAVVRLATREKSNHPKGMRYSVDCHFERALRFRPDDHVVRMLWAQWLGHTKRSDQAIKQLERVEVNDDPLTAFNLGMVYFELGALDRAEELAIRAKALGHPSTVLQELLIGAGRQPSGANVAPSVQTPLPPPASARD